MLFFFDRKHIEVHGRPTAAVFRSKPNTHQDQVGGETQTQIQIQIQTPSRTMLELFAHAKCCNTWLFKDHDDCDSGLFTNDRYRNLWIVNVVIQSFSQMVYVAIQSYQLAWSVDSYSPIEEYRSRFWEYPAIWGQTISIPCSSSYQLSLWLY